MPGHYTYEIKYYLCSKIGTDLEEETFNYPQARAFAGQYGLVVGLMWIVSFACAMYAYDYESLGIIGNLVGLLSLFVEVKLLKQFQAEIAPLSTGRRLWMGWTVSMYAAMLNSFAQFVYLKFLDRGHLMDSFYRMMEQPEFRQAMESIMPGQDMGEFIEQLANLPMGALLVNFIAFNFFVALVFAVICFMLSKFNKTPNS